MVKSGTEIIMFSDGFADQKGSQTNKKFYYKPFRDLFLEMSGLNTEEKSDFLANKFENWKGNLKQADDVFVWGLKI